MEKRFAELLFKHDFVSGKSFVRIQAVDIFFDNRESWSSIEAHHWSSKREQTEKDRQAVSDRKADGLSNSSKSGNCGDEGSKQWHARVIALIRYPRKIRLLV